VPILFNSLTKFVLNQSMSLHLLVVEDDQGQWEMVLADPIYSVGRDPKCDIRLVSQFVSRRHATLVQFPNEDGVSYYYRIVDGNLRGKTSANGLIINGQKLPTHDLHNGDEVVFAPEVRAIYYLLNNDQYAQPNLDSPTISHPLLTSYLASLNSEIGPKEHPTIGNNVIQALGHRKFSSGANLERGVGPWDNLQEG
jgi:pSer/pThr/pTyr-binding forkhead associated (FHA) protein